MKLFSFLSQFLILFASCTSQHQKELDVDEYYDLSTATPGVLTDVFSDVELTPLLFEGDYYPSEVYTLYFHDSIIIVQDNKDDIFVFDSDGHYRSSSKQVRGQGPGEYSIYMGYSYNPYTGLIQVLTPDKMMCYTPNFSFIEEHQLPSCLDPTGKESLLFTSIYDLSKHSHLLTTLSSSTIKNVYVSYNSNTENIGDTINFSHYIIALGNRQYKNFFNLSNGEYFAKPGFVGEYIFSFDPERLELTPAIKFNMGRESVTRKEFLANSDEKDYYAFYNYLDASKRTIVDGAHPTKDRIFFSTTNGRRLNRVKFMVADRRTGEIKEFNFWDDDELFFPRLNDFDDEHLYSGVSKYELLKSPDLLLGKDINLDSLLSYVDDDAIIMLKYKIK